MPSKADLENPGYTPRRQDWAAVFDWLYDDDPKTSKQAERALTSVGSAVIAEAVERLARSSTVERVALVRLLGKLAQSTRDPSAGAVLIAALADGEARVVRAAIVALGKLPHSAIDLDLAEQALLDQWPRLQDAERRAAIECLGKIGGARAHAVLSAITAPGSVEAPLLTRALLRLGRATQTIEVADSVCLNVPLGIPCDVAILHRRGLSEIVQRQLQPLVESIAESSEQRLVRQFSGPLGALFHARSMLMPALVIPIGPAELQRPNSDADWAEAITHALTREEVQTLLERITTTRPRLRLSMQHEGHQRALIWRISELLNQATQRMSVNPTAAIWEAQIDRGRRPRVYLLPKRFDDPRFGYRVAEISGASHPTIAAALADIAAPGRADVVWDPFVGSGLELVECGRNGTYRELIGTDNDPRSLEAAATNVRTAQLDRVRLLNADARTAQLPNVSVIVTNPPLGIRHRRDGMLLQLLLEFLNNARRNLTDGGRLVWLSPLPQQTAEHAQRLGFVVERRGSVDVGGLSPELQVMQLSRSRGSSWRS